MNIYLDYLIKNFGGYHLEGAKFASDLIEGYDISNISSAYQKYAKVIGSTRAAVERNVRHYIKIIGDKENIENVLKCKCINNKNFTNKEFLTMVKLRAKENKYDK